MFNQQATTPISPENMKATGLTFQEHVVRESDRLAQFMPQLAISKGGLEPEEVFSMYMGVRIFVAMVKPVSTDKFKDKIEELRKKFNFTDLKNMPQEKRTVAVDNLLDMYEMALEQFRYMGLIPPIDDVDYWPTSVPRTIPDDEYVLQPGDLDYKKEDGDSDSAVQRSTPAPDKGSPDLGNGVGGNPPKE